VTLDLTPDGPGIGEPLPGQFTMLYAFGAGEAPISVSGCPADDGVLRHTVRRAGAVTRALCALTPGQAVGVRGPYGAGWPLPAAARPDLVVVAGGIGLAPLRPVMRRVVAGRERFGRVALVVGTRTPDDLLFRPELTAWRGSLDLQVEVTVDAAPPSWRGDVGVVTKLLPRLRLDPGRTVALVCGPEVMMRVVARHLVGAGLAPDRIHVSLERNMACAVGHCGHCQLGPLFVCRDGPVVAWSAVAPLLGVRGR
jgi:anaerobic sulfite reductase subunit B